ncbi:uncharacterized protein LOC121730557 [Aricia agestis]|uniref:uncharacterized protein LOC121730557 n=1 Tax=Aricia agestis TaxID=91739 RepID=UPI001C2023B2|nr:uncharacterized protein LOC121730557 [Aricia agestis]
MFSSRSFAVCALLTVAAAAGPAVNPKLALADKKIPARRLYKEPDLATVDRANYYSRLLEQCWTEVTDDNYRVIINVDGNRKDELTVSLQDSNVIVVKTATETFRDVLRGKEVLNKITFTETRQVPPKVIAAAATATLTSDGFLVVDLPLDAKAADQTPYDRNVPVVESGKPLGSKRPAPPPTKLTPDEAYWLVWYMVSSLLKSLALYANIETKIEATDDSFRFITKLRNATDVTKDDVEVFTNAGYVFMSSLTGQVADSYRLPRNCDVDAITAALTSDDYLVVEVPIVEGAAKPAWGVKEVPVEELGLTLEEMADRLETENDDGDKEVVKDDDADKSQEDKLVKVAF